ncbi:unnamed protein product, partial [Mesorhabditis spiculigera]
MLFEINFDETMHSMASSSAKALEATGFKAFKLPRISLQVAEPLLSIPDYTPIRRVPSAPQLQKLAPTSEKLHNTTLNVSQEPRRFRSFSDIPAATTISRTIQKNVWSLSAFSLVKNL